MNFRPSARAIDCPMEVFPVPGGPAKQSMGPLESGFNFLYAVEAFLWYKTRNEFVGGIPVEERSKPPTGAHSSQRTG